MKTDQWLLGCVALVAFGACAELAGIEDAHPRDEGTGGAGGETSGSSGSTSASSGSASSSASSSSTSGSGVGGPWAGWPMPNPPSTGLPNPASYTVDMVKDIVTDNVTGLVWQRTVDSGSYTWTGAKQYCDNLMHGGYSDWRLPSRIELVSIVDFTSTAPAIDIAAFPSTPQTGFWTLLSKGASSAVAVNFGKGLALNVDSSASLSVRCLR